MLTGRRDPTHALAGSSSVASNTIQSRVTDATDINDSVTSTEKTWSSQKINNEKANEFINYDRIEFNDVVKDEDIDMLYYDNVIDGGTITTQYCRGFLFKVAQDGFLYQLGVYVYSEQCYVGIYEANSSGTEITKKIFVDGVPVSGGFQYVDCEVYLKTGQWYFLGADGGNYRVASDDESSNISTFISNSNLSEFEPINATHYNLGNADLRDLKGTTINGEQKLYAPAIRAYYYSVYPGLKAETTGDWAMVHRLEAIGNNRNAELSINTDSGYGIIKNTENNGNFEFLEETDGQIGYISDTAYHHYNNQLMCMGYVMYTNASGTIRNHNFTAEINGDDIYVRFNVSMESVPIIKFMPLMDVGTPYFSALDSAGVNITFYSYNDVRLRADTADTLGFALVGFNST